MLAELIPSHPIPSHPIPRLSRCLGGRGSAHLKQLRFVDAIDNAVGWIRACVAEEDGDALEEASKLVIVLIWVSRQYDISTITYTITCSQSNIPVLVE